MASLAYDQLETVTFVLVTMLLVVMLVLLWALTKLWQYGEFDSIIDRLRPSRLQVINIDWLPENKTNNEEEGDIVTEQIGPCSKVLTEGNDGRLHWKLSEEYLNRLNKAWDKCHVIDMSEAPSVIDIEECCHEESPGDDMSGSRQKRQVKWSKFNSVFYYNKNDALQCEEDSPTLLVPNDESELPKSILKKTTDVCLPVDETTEEGDLEKTKSNLGFKYVTKTLLSFLDDTCDESDGLNDVELGEGPTTSKPRRYQYISKSLLSFLDETPEESV